MPLHRASTLLAALNDQLNGEMDHAAVNDAASEIELYVVKVVCRDSLCMDI